MNHQCHWTEVENIFLPREATIVRSVQATPTETHFTLQMTDGQPMEYEPGQIVELSLFGYGEIPIGFASSPTRKNTFDLVVRTVGRVSGAVNRCDKGQSLYVRGPLGHGFDLDEAPRAGRAHRRRRHRPLPDAEPDPVHPRPARRVQALHPLLRRARARSSSSSSTISPSGGRPDDVEYYETVDKGDPSWKGNVGVITTLFPKVELDARDARGHLRPAGHVTGSSSASSTRSASRARTSSSTSSAA